MSRIAGAISTYPALHRRLPILRLLLGCVVARCEAALPGTTIVVLVFGATGSRLRADHGTREVRQRDLRFGNLAMPALLPFEVHIPIEALLFEKVDKGHDGHCPFAGEREIE